MVLRVVRCPVVADGVDEFTLQNVANSMMNSTLYRVEQADIVERQESQHPARHAHRQRPVLQKSYQSVHCLSSCFIMGKGTPDGQGGPYTDYGL